VVFLGASFFAHSASVRLHELDVTAMTADWGQPQKNLSLTQPPLSIAGGQFAYGVGTHANWADSTFEFDGAPPQTVQTVVAGEDAVILTPPTPREPRINGPKIYGVRPGSPFLYRIPCTGERPLLFRAEGLPKGLALDSSSGIITG